MKYTRSLVMTNIKATFLITMLVGIIGVAPGQVILLSQKSSKREKSPVAASTRIASLEVEEAGNLRSFVVWRVPIKASYHVERDSSGKLVPKGSLADQAYILAVKNSDSQENAQVLWRTYFTDDKGANVLYPLPKKLISLAWNSVNKRVYVIDVEGRGGHGSVMVYEVNPQNSLGTYPPLELGSESGKEVTPPAQVPIVEFNPAEAGHLFLGPEQVQALTEPNRLIISIWTLRETSSGQQPNYFEVDLDQKKWSRVSIN